ncbi:Rtr1/RPAP2 family-domain-containing protein [Chytridium lagenaria]|nr:Rtr1/RPAP2 family-domain-containing protein [Chytridium lagenaria]
MPPSDSLLPRTVLALSPSFSIVLANNSDTASCQRCTTLPQFLSLPFTISLSSLSIHESTGLGKRVNEVQESLFEGAVDVHVLAEAAKFLKPDQYDDVVVERVAEKTCGYPLCDKPVTKRKGQYHISRSKLKVYDATELSKYCSATCLAISRYYRRQLLDDPIYLRDFNKLPKFEVIPCNISPSDISNLTVPHPDKVSRDQLLSEYVQSLLDRLPMSPESTSKNGPTPLTIC